MKRLKMTTTKFSLFLIWSVLVIVGWGSMYENAHVQAMTIQRKNISINNLDINQMEIKNSKPRRLYDRCPRTFGNGFSEYKIEFQALGTVLIAICKEIHELGEAYFMHQPSFFTIYILLKTPDGKIEKVYWQVNNFADLERIVSLLKESKISQLSVDESKTWAPPQTQGSKEPSKLDTLDSGMLSERNEPKESEVLKESKNILSTPFFCESCEVSGFTLFP